MPRGTDKVRFAVEAVLLTALAVLVFMPWGCSKAPMAPVPPARQLELPNGVIAQPGELLSETQEDTSGLLTTRPTGDGATATGLLGSLLNIVGEILKLPLIEKIIGPLGGQILIDISGEQTYYTVPAGALLSPTKISVAVTRVENTRGDRITTFDFGPSGLLFLKPTHLAYKSALPEGSMQYLYWQDPVRKVWVLAAVAPVVNGYATFPIEHFSKYATTERGVSLGGQ